MAMTSAPPRCLLLLLLILPIHASIFEQTTKSRCQPIDIPICKDIPYNMTIYPNPLFSHDQQSLQAQTEHFKPLIKTKCNPHVKFFICSVFAPMCPDQLPQAVTSCRSVCEEVKRDCINILQEFDLQWPAPLNCSQFPEGPDLCMRPQASAVYDDIPDEVDPHSHLPDAKHLEVYKATKAYPACPIDLIDLDPTDVNATCAFRCNKDSMYSRETKTIAQQWLILGASANAGVCLFVLATFLIDHRRFTFPERSVLYIALSYLLASLPFIARALLKHEQTACERLRASDKLFLVHGGLDNSICVVSFLFAYYFAFAGALWWLMLTFTWYLSAAREWVQEEIEKRATYLHLLAWGLPCLLTIVVLILQKVDASELTGVCGVGNSDLTSLLFLVIVPQAAIVLIGLCFIVSGFSSMCRQRQCFRQRGTDTTKLEKFMCKMGIFTLLYVGGMIAILICESFRAQSLQLWQPATIGCKQAGGADKGRCRRPPQPDAVYGIARLSISLLLGATTAIWIASTKTIRSWRQFLCCGSCQAPSTAKYHPAVPVVPQGGHHYVVGYGGSLSGSGSGGGSGGGVNGQQASSRIPLIPPSRNPPPPPPPPSANHYIPLSIMTSTNNGVSVTYASNGEQWKNSKPV